MDTARLTDACASLDADVLCLQEIDRGQARSGGVDQTAEIAKACAGCVPERNDGCVPERNDGCVPERNDGCVPERNDGYVPERNDGATAWRFEPALLGEPGGTWHAATDDDHDDGPGYGVAIVSRHPVHAWHVVRLKAAPVKAPVAVPGGRGRFIVLPDEPRVGLVADLGDVLIATTHLSFVPGYNLVQLRRLTTELAAIARDRPCILAGDLNAPGPFPHWASGWRPLARVKTYPADRPSLQVDHVLARAGPRPLPEVTGVEALRLPLSDHRALVVALASGPWP